MVLCRTVLSFIILSMLGLAAPALAQNDAAKLEAAKRYLEASDFNNTLVNSVRSVCMSKEPGDLEGCEKRLGSVMDVEKIKTVALESMMEVFSTEELKALADFYGSPTGQGILKKFPAYMGKVIPALAREMQGAVQKMGQSAGDRS